MWSEKILGKREVLVFFICTSLVYIFPFVHADYAYVDDNWRSLLLADESWRTHGRLLLEGLTKFLAFNNATINIFPLPLLIATLAVALAMCRLTWWYFPQPGLAACLVVLPMLCNPFFLGNITYQYDGPGMMLALAAAISAVTLDIRNIYFRGLSSAMLVVVILSLYQLTITVFVGLIFVECVWGVRNKKAPLDVLWIFFQRVLQLAVGGVVYYLTIFQMAISRRMDSTFSDPQWLDGMSRKFVFSIDKVLELVTAGNLYFSVVLLLVAGVGYVWLMISVLQLNGRRREKALVFLVCLCVIPVLIVGIPGAMLLAAEPHLEARNYLGFSVVLFLLFLLNYEFLGRVWHGLRLLLIIPVLCMFSFCYAYGQVIVAKKEFEMALATFVAYDIVTTPELREANIFYLITRRGEGNWLPSGQGTMSYMPVLRYILSDSNKLLYPHFLTRLGINTVVDGERQVFEAALSASKTSQPLLDRKFYSIYVTEAGNYILMKNIVDYEGYIEQP
ncbi:glucosyltransferase domain-containing protein [Pseudomonas citri]|uniref:glucosyltransferase domain-containing protein n=1 Tax=Pseudomonas citri TaxID=2978349 RepID=UPI0021B583FB|nr:glucosyltransferase domain-containing protein [Pseudomonas citri]